MNLLKQIMDWGKNFFYAPPKSIDSYFHHSKDDGMCHEKEGEAGLSLRHFIDEYVELLDSRKKLK